MRCTDEIMRYGHRYWRYMLEREKVA